MSVHSTCAVCLEGRYSVVYPESGLRRPCFTRHQMFRDLQGRDPRRGEAKSAIPIYHQHGPWSTVPTVLEFPARWDAARDMQYVIWRTWLMALHSLWSFCFVLCPLLREWRRSVCIERSSNCSFPTEYLASAKWSATCIQSDEPSFRDDQTSLAARPVCALCAASKSPKTLAHDQITRLCTRPAPNLE
ncbi:hypothetical protein LZ30DRAFT_81012 [Colletotrichum cereale]|nr:hypothetical protein LZ30DRAFT_81012 [Colletotrichum cereale]